MSGSGPPVSLPVDRGLPQRMGMATGLGMGWGLLVLIPAQPWSRGQEWGWELGVEVGGL